MTKTIRYTDAPDAYDGFGTETTSTIGTTKRGNPIRRVEIAPEHLDWQVGRYYSGLYGCWDEADLSDLVGAGICQR